MEDQPDEPIWSCRIGLPIFIDRNQHAQIACIHRSTIHQHRISVGMYVRTLLGMKAGGIRELAVPPILGFRTDPQSGMDAQTLFYVTLILEKVE